MNINSTEQEMVLIKNRYEQQSQMRNSCGIHLLDRNDELCILYERLNVQKEVEKTGEKALMETDQEIRDLKLIMTTICRKLELAKQKMPIKLKTIAELHDLEDQREIMDKKIQRLSNAMENPQDPSRCRDLGGEDPSPEELVKKIEKLQIILSQKEVNIIQIGKNIRKGPDS
jgi:hypothetical protein